MRTRTCLLKVLQLLITLWVWPHSANAYYDPGVQRWICRDPLGEEGFENTHAESVVETESDVAVTPATLNLYRFVENRPVIEIDSFGLFLGFGHGNWCGYSRRGPGFPIDEVDAACMNHDYCLATWQDACKFKFCNFKFCREVARAKCHGDKACKKAKRKIMIGCFIIVPIPPFIWM